MIFTGIDIVSCQRFKSWQTYPRKFLEKIFTTQEIDYCLAMPAKSAERLAVRFAAKEAFFKAWCSCNPFFSRSFRKVALDIEVGRIHNGSPFLKIEWAVFKVFHPIPLVQISLSHTDKVGIAMVLLYFSENMHSSLTKIKN